MAYKIIRLQIVLLLCLAVTACSIFTQQAGNRNALPEVTSSHYRVFRGDGTPATLENLIDSVNEVQVAFLGENHNDPVAHYLESEILRRVDNVDLALSLEMFEADVQMVVDEYLAGFISEDHLIASGRAWDNYVTAYKPLVEYAREHKLPVIAANAPRRYVNMVNRLGDAALEELEPEARRYLPPLPYAQANPDYAEKFFNLMRPPQDDSEVEEAEHNNVQASTADEEQERELARSLRAQSLWDATMAHAIAGHLADKPGAQVIHVNGSFHTAEGMGIPDHLQQYRPDTSVLVVTMIPADPFPAFLPEEMKGEGDFIIVTDATLLPGS